MNGKCVAVDLSHVWLSDG